MPVPIARPPSGRGAFGLDLILRSSEPAGPGVRGLSPHRPERHHETPRPATEGPACRAVLALAAMLAGVAVLGLSPRALGQFPTSEERLKILTDPESVKKKAEKEQGRKPPLEMLSLTQVAPFDILPYVKANHWSTDHPGADRELRRLSPALRPRPWPWLGFPQEIIYRREARLPKTQRSRLSVQMILPAIPKDIGLELTRADGSRPVESWPARLSQLEPHQMLVVFLTKETNDTTPSGTASRPSIPPRHDRDDDGRCGRSSGTTASSCP